MDTHSSSLFFDQSAAQVFVDRGGVTNVPATFDKLFVELASRNLKATVEIAQFFAGVMSQSLEPARRQTIAFEIRLLE